MPADCSLLTDDLYWYRVVLAEIAPHLGQQPGLGRACALRVDDPVATAVVRMIARHMAQESGAAVARYCLQTGYGAAQTHAS